MKITVETYNHEEQILEDIVNEDVLETWARYFDEVFNTIVKVREEFTELNPTLLWATLSTRDTEHMYFQPDMSTLTNTLTFCYGDWVYDGCTIRVSVSFSKEGSPSIHRTISANYTLNNDQVDVDDLDTALLPCECNQNMVKL